MQHQKISILLVFALLGAVLAPINVGAAPAPTTFSSATDDTNGGKTITITGSGFTDPSTVLFGSTPATSVTYDSPTQLTVEVPPHSAGTVDVTVTDDSGLSGQLAGFTYTSADAPTITSLSVNSGSTNGGTTVTVTGEDFVSDGSIDSKVTVGGVLARSITVNSDTSITITTPANTAGASNVVVINPDGQSDTLASSFTFVAPTAPSITTVVGSTGGSTGGDSVTITGSGFVTSGSQEPVVTFSGTIAEITGTPTSSSITVKTPARSPGFADVTVSNPDGQRAIKAGAFNFLADPDPEADAVTPTSGSTLGGTELTITGSDFATASGSAGDATVTVGGLQAKITAISSSSITVLTPPHSAGAVNVVVTNPDGQSDTLSSVFTYESALQITGASPASGTKNGATTITLSGVDLQADSKAFIDFDDDGVMDTGEEALKVAKSGSNLLIDTPPRADSDSDGPFDIFVIGPAGRTASLTAAFTYSDANAPTITGVSDPTATHTCNGGQSVTITGTNFHTKSLAKPTVNFGSNTVDPEDVTVSSSTSITVKTPARTGCPIPPLDEDVDVTVTNPDGQSDTETDEYTYERASAPTVSSVSDPSGTNTRNGGQTVTITGTGFTADSTVTVGGADAEIVSTTGSTQIKIKTPPSASTGAKTILVSNPDGQSDGSKTFTYETTSAPTIASLDVTSGSTLGRTTVKITGTNFDPSARPTVTFGGTEAEVTGVTATTVTVQTPTHSSGSVTVVVTNPSTQSASLSNAFTYNLGGVPDIASVSPLTGELAGGTEITILGSNFGTALTTFTIGGNPVTEYEIVDSGQITATTPAHSAGLVEIVIDNADNQGGEVLPNGFRYLPAAPRMDLDPLSVETGSSNGGTSVSIEGDAFTTAVVFGGKLADITSDSSMTVVVDTPAHAAGDVDVQVIDEHGQTTTLENGFSYFTAEAPTITTVQPASGPATGGTTVTVTGTGFSTGTGLEPTVSVGGTFAEIVSVSTTAIEAITPAHVAGQTTVTVTNADGQSASRANSFKFLGQGGPPAPTISGISPDAGPSSGGTAVTISGSNFQAGATVKFGGVSATVSSITSGSISVTTPAHSPGDVDVVVTNPDLQSHTLPDGFDYSAAAAPTITSVTPSSGPVSGGTTITITGTGFQSGLTVTVGGGTATVSTVSSTSISATTPAGTAGAKNVVVTNPDSQSVTSTGAFRYTGTTTTSTTTTSTTSTQTSTQTNTQTNTGTSTQTSTNTGTGTSTSTSTSTGGTGTPTAAQIKAYNNRIDVEVEETDDGNLVTFTLPSGAPATVQGVQVWYRNSPWQHAASLDDSSQAFQDGEYLHSGSDAQSDTEYLVTAYYALSSAGGHFAQPGSTPSEEDYPEGQGAGDGGLPLWAWLLIFLGGLLLLGLLIAIIVAASRGRDDDEDVGDWSPGATSAAWTSQESGWDEAPTQEEAGDDGHDTHHIKCPSCETRFTAVGERPLVTHCPGCGKKGVLN